MTPTDRDWDVFGWGLAAGVSLAITVTVAIITAMT